MNLLLLEGDEIDGDGATARIRGRRAEHIRTVLSAGVGQSLRAGVIGGALGSARIEAITRDEVRLALAFDRSPPPPVPVSLVLALPRPKAARRVLQTVATMGVKRVVLVNSARVEKSYWESPFLQPEAVREQLVIGLEQAGDTILPIIATRRRFKPFVEDELPLWLGESTGLVAHPAATTPCPRGVTTAMALAIGPEGGFVDYEIELLERTRFLPVTLGERRLRVEQAVAALLGRLT